MKIQRDIRDLPVISRLIREEHPAKIVNFLNFLPIPNHHHILEPEKFSKNNAFPDRGIITELPGLF